MQARAEEMEVQLQFEPTDEMPELMFDPEALHRAILNIITNAIDACDETEAAQVSVSTMFDSEHRLAKLTVEDNGPGIPPDDLDSIFNIFVSRKGGRGTGLGLPVSRKIMEEHGGQITVDSDVGQGSRFTLELPGTQSAANPEDPAAEDPPASVAVTSETVDKSAEA